MRGRGLLGLVAALVALGAVPAQAGAAAAPSVNTMIVGEGATLLAPSFVKASARTVRVSGRLCRVAAGTPLAALLGAGAAGRISGIGLRDYGRCSRTRASSASSLFVHRHRGRRAIRGRNGWVYKVGRRAPGADRRAPFGSGRASG